MLNIEDFAKTGELFDGRYKLIRTLNTEGGTADVWLALDMNTVDQPEWNEDGETITAPTHDDSGLQVAIKVYRPKNFLDIEGEQRFRDEYKIVFNCHHTNLLQPINFSIFKETPYLVLPYCSHGSSEAMIGQNVGNAVLWKYIAHVGSGLAYLHDLRPPIIHQDVKPANVLIDDNDNFTLTDFGISAKFDTNRHNGYDDESIGTMAYMAPERFIEGYKPTAESDIWAFGATLYEIITGKVPFGENGGLEQRVEPSQLPFPEWVDKDIRRVIQECLQYIPQKRPTAQQLASIGKAGKYPSKVMKVLKILWLPVLLLVMAGAIFFLLNRNKEIQIIEQTIVTKPAKEIYQEAMTLMKMNQSDSIKAGIELLNTIEDSTYIPALYELAFTYGCYSDTLSLKRKELMGIQVGNENVDPRAKKNMAPYLPKEDIYNNKAMDLFRRIVELPGDDYKETKMNAAYRLGIYYLYYTRSVPLAKQYYLRCQNWANELGDENMQQMVAVALQEAR
ncbi:MAG: serine/threonine protein kinase [Prevotella sp.]|nr:serine/threonine protein kinase [Prevotella sp.]